MVAIGQGGLCDGVIALSGCDHLVPVRNLNTDFLRAGRLLLLLLLPLLPLPLLPLPNTGFLAAAAATTGRGRLG